MQTSLDLHTARPHRTLQVLLKKKKGCTERSVCCMIRHLFTYFLKNARLFPKGSNCFPLVPVLFGVPLNNPLFFVRHGGHWRSFPSVQLTCSCREEKWFLASFSSWLEIQNQPQYLSIISLCSVCLTSGLPEVCSSLQKSTSEAQTT